MRRIELLAVHPAHPEVGEEHVGGSSRAISSASARSRDERHPVALLPEDLGEELAHDRLVVDDEDVGGGRARRRRRRPRVGSGMWT